MAKHVVASNLVTPGTIFDSTYDSVEFAPNFFVVFTDVADARQHISWAWPNMHKVTISPEGVAYAGDAAPGNGAKKVTIDFAGVIVTVVMTQVDDISTEFGWLVITKGEDVIAYSPTIVYQAIVEPTP